MAEIPAPQVLPEEEQATQTRADETLAPGYVVICWDDPVNLMDYVTHVFMTIFGWQRPKAEQHMLQVHRQGKSVLTRDGLERAEHYVHRLQSYGLTATLEPLITVFMGIMILTLALAIFLPIWDMYEALANQ